MVDDSSIGRTLIWIFFDSCKKELLYHKYRHIGEGNHCHWQFKPYQNLHFRLGWNTVESTCQCKAGKQVGALCISAGFLHAMKIGNLVGWKCWSALVSKEEIACEKHWLALLFCAAGSFEGNCATWLTYIQPKIFHLSPSMGPNVAKVVWQSNESSIYVCLVWEWIRSGRVLWNHYVLKTCQRNLCSWFWRLSVESDACSVYLLAGTIIYLSGKSAAFSVEVSEGVLDWENVWHLW